MPKHPQDRQPPQRPRPIAGMPSGPSDDPRLLSRMTTDIDAATQVIEDMVWRAIYYVKSAGLYSAGPYSAPYTEQTFLDSAKAQCRMIAQQVLRAYQAGYVQGELEGKGYKPSDSH
jgi:hypothetical protein